MLCGFGFYNSLLYTRGELILRKVFLPHLPDHKWDRNPQTAEALPCCQFFITCLLWLIIYPSIFQIFLLPFPFLSTLNPERKPRESKSPFCTHKSLFCIKKCFFYKPLRNSALGRKLFCHLAFSSSYHSIIHAGTYFSRISSPAEV